MRTRRYLERIENLLNRLDAAVVVRDLGNARSAEVFEGLRKTIIRSGKSHRSHIAHLLALQESLDRGATLNLIKNRVSDFLRELGVEKLTSLEMRDWFEIVGGTGDGLELVEPAIVERLSDGSLLVLQLGKARRIDIPKESPVVSQEKTTVPDAEKKPTTTDAGDTPTGSEQLGAQS
jgi:hypothetical protein